MRARDAESWSALVDLYGPLIFAWCQRGKLPDDAAADVMQETFLAICQSINSFTYRGKGDRFRGWLFGITRNHIALYWRRRERVLLGTGGSTAAPYKHFKDRTDLLNALVSDAMDRLATKMAEQRDRYPTGTYEAVAGIGQAYIDFAKAEPGIFRLMFGLTEGHEDEDALQKKGKLCREIVETACGACIGADASDQAAILSAYILWTSVHGHAFLSIDNKNKDEAEGLDDWDFLMAVTCAVLDASARR